MIGWCAFRKMIVFHRKSNFSNVPFYFYYIVIINDSLRFDKLLNDQTEMDENLNITIPKTNLAAIYKLTDGHLTPSPVKNHSRVPPSGGTSPNCPNKG